MNSNVFSAFENALRRKNGTIHWHWQTGKLFVSRCCRIESKAKAAVGRVGEIQVWHARMEAGHSRKRGEKPSTTATEWCFKRLISLERTYSNVLPSFGSITKVSLNACVKCMARKRCSALKCIKTWLWNRLRTDMLQSRMMISIKGPGLGTLECETLITQYSIFSHTTATDWGHWSSWSLRLNPHLWDFWPSASF